MEIAHTSRPYLIHLNASNYSVFQNSYLGLACYNCEKKKSYYIFVRSYLVNMRYLEQKTWAGSFWLICT